MQKKISQKLSLEAKNRAGLVGAYFDCFVTWMQQYGYSEHTILTNLKSVTRFGKYLKQRGIHEINRLEGIEGQKLLSVYERYREGQGQQARIYCLRLYLRALEAVGILSPTAPKSPALSCATLQYVTYLKNFKGLSESSVKLHIYWVEKFLRFIKYQKNESATLTFRIVDVDRFIVDESRRLKHAPHRSLVVSLRSFLRFLYQTRKITTDISGLIISPRSYSLKSLPQTLNWAEIQKILNDIDRLARSGIRDYAILVLLVTYGLRVGETANLKLENINWRKETIHIVSRKTGDELWLPLTPQVGKAILLYLQRGRPVSRYRELFLLTHAPWTPIQKASISHMVTRRIKSAGFLLPRYGSHLLRHSFATNLIRQNVPLKHIGDLLGQRDLKSTELYTKTAVENLRETALEVPEVQQWKTK